MEGFSLLSISGPWLPASALRAPRAAASLPDIAKAVCPAEASGSAQVWPPRNRSSVLRNGAQSTLPPPDCISRDPQTGEQLRQKCTIYRPWFSPYSYLLGADKESYLQAPSFPEGQQDKGRGDSCLPEDLADSICSSSSSPPENPCPRGATWSPGRGLDTSDRITSQDILTACTWQPAQNGYKCAACCRLYPTLHSLQSHVRGGFREGFSCGVYYRRLKALWGKEQSTRPPDRLSQGSCQAFK